MRNENAEMMNNYQFELNSLMDMLPCGVILFNRELAAEGFNEGAREFFHESCALRLGMEFEELAGALWDMADDGCLGEAEVLAGFIQAFEECTIDYRRFDGKHYRMSAKPAFHPDFSMSLLIMDISDIMESERVQANRSRELASQRSALNSRLRMADALASEREAKRLGKQFAGRLTLLLDSFEDVLKNGNTGVGFAELKKQREYAGMLACGGRREEFAERLKKSLSPEEGDFAPRVVFHHIASPRCGTTLENGIIEAAREGVMLIAMCGTADVVEVSLRVFDGGMELTIRSDEPVIPDFETAEAYARLKKISKKMCAQLETDTSNGFDLNLRCVFPSKTELPAALVALEDAGYMRGVCETLGGGAEPILRCIAASPDIDLNQAYKRYSPSVLIAEPGLIEKYAKALKSLDSRLRIIGICAPGDTVSGMARHYLNGYLSRDIRPEGLRAAVNSVMRGLKVWTGENLILGAEDAARRYGLSDIEQRIVRMTGRGMSSEKIASELHYSQGSLRNMLSAIYVKLGVSDRVQLTAFAILNGFTE